MADLSVSRRRRWLAAGAAALCSFALTSISAYAGATVPATWSAVTAVPYSLSAAGQAAGTALVPPTTYGWIVAGRTRTTWLATDGSAILRSTDQGHSWHESFNVTTALVGVGVDVGYAAPYAEPYYVSTLAAAPYPGDGNVVYALLLPNSDYSASAVGTYGVGYIVLPDPPSLLASSTDGGMTWRISGLAPNQLTSLEWPHCKQTVLGGGPSLLVAPSDPRVVYIVNCDDSVALAAAKSESNGNGALGTFLFRSADSGNSWSMIQVTNSTLTLPYGAAVANEMRVDPLSPHTLWFTQLQDVADGKGKLRVLTAYRSSDDGANWKTFLTPERGVSDLAIFGLDVIALGHGPTRVLLWSSDHGVVATDTAHLASWHAVDKLVKGGPLYTGAAFVPRSGDVLMAKLWNGGGWDAAITPSCASTSALVEFGYDGRLHGQVAGPGAALGSAIVLYPLYVTPVVGTNRTMVYLQGQTRTGNGNACKQHFYDVGTAPGLLATVGR